MTNFSLSTCNSQSGKECCLCFLGIPFSPEIRTILLTIRSGVPQKKQHTQIIRGHNLIRDHWYKPCLTSGSLLCQNPDLITKVIFITTGAATHYQQRLEQRWVSCSIRNSHPRSGSGSNRKPGIEDECLFRGIIIIMMMIVIVGGCRSSPLRTRTQTADWQ